MVPAQKPRAITVNKSQTRHLQEEEEDDDEDDEEDDDDEVDDSHLVPSERHLHSFIGHWQVRTSRIKAICNLNKNAMLIVYYHTSNNINKLILAA